jgi:very-short-patch-repair endonuclease
MLICKFCNKECKNLNAWRNHERLCKDNPDKQVSNLTTRTNKTPWNKGLSKLTDDRVRKNAEAVSLALVGKPSKIVWTEEMRRAKSEWRKQLHKDFPETHPNRRLAGNRKKMSYPEKVAFDFFTKYNISFEHQKKIDRFYPDFVIGNLIIEIDGATWHDKEKDKARDEIISSYGYQIVRIVSTENIEERLKSILGVG